MGRRKKAAKKVVKKLKLVVPKVFKCLFCNHEEAVVCQLDFNAMTGDLACRICDAKYQTSINNLTEPIDVFSDWIDEVTEKQQADNRRVFRHITSDTTATTYAAANAAAVNDFIDNTDDQNVDDNDDEYDG